MHPALVVRRTVLFAALATSVATTARAQTPDPRVGLRPGLHTAGEAIWNLRQVSNRPRPAGFYNDTNPGDFGFLASDLAFRGHQVFQGSFAGWQVWDITDPAAPTLRKTYPCAGGQGDLSLHGNLLFMSVEETRGRLDCTSKGVTDSVSADRFRGVRILDISDLDHPRILASVQTCRGSHTHTLVVDPKDTANVYIYVAGTSVTRSPSELAGCSPLPPEKDPNTSLFRIEVIRVPLAAPQTARVVSTPRIFASATGALSGLTRPAAHGDTMPQASAPTNQCHDITVYSAIGLAAGACSGNGILLDISDPVHPRRVAEVSDANFAYWHSATFSNAGDKVVFTDEWGGGTSPRCRASDRAEWGADAIFTRRGRTLTMAGYYKIPAPQTEQENCVAHNGSIIPIPGRDVMVQGWYQGGLSVFDFTDAAHPKEIAYFDRGPIDSTRMYIGGFWAGYWYNGRIIGSEIARGLDIFELVPSEHLSQNEIDAAKLVQVDVLNPQNQQRIVWPASFVVARAYVDQLERGRSLAPDRIERIRGELADAERRSSTRSVRALLTRLASRLESDARRSTDAARVRALRGVVRQLAAR